MVYSVYLCFSLHDMRVVIFLFFIGLSMFNAVTTWIEQIVEPRGFNFEQAGIIGACMMLGGIIGAITPFMVAFIFLMIFNILVTLKLKESQLIHKG